MGRIALVGETFAAARDVMIEGPAGLLKIHEPGERPAWSPTLRKLEWRNGAVAHVFSAEDPDSLRGPQFEAAWCDELAKWRHVEETWDMLQFGLRLGARPREVVTTTPRPIPLLRRLLADRARRQEPGADRRQCQEPRARLSRDGRRPLRRHAPGPPGARGRDDRGPAGRAVAARRHRGAAVSSARRR